MKPYDDCIYCGGEVDEKRVTLDYRVGAKLYIVKGVKTGVCRQCGERFLTAAVAKKLEKMVKTPPTPLNTVAVPVLKG